MSIPRTFIVTNDECIYYTNLISPNIYKVIHGENTSKEIKSKSNIKVDYDTKRTEHGVGITVSCHSINLFHYNGFLINFLANNEAIYIEVYKKDLCIDYRELGFNGFAHYIDRHGYIYFVEVEPYEKVVKYTLELF